MTKLTKEQIEQERVKFEKWFIQSRYYKNYNFSSYKNEFTADEDGPYYRNANIDFFFQGWLARAELTKPKARKFLPLTDKQLNVLSYIEQYINEKGYSPKFKEVQKALNFKSESSINAIVKHLVNKGYLIKSNGWRGLELAKGGE